MELNLNEQEQNRRNALVQMRELGIEPYPAAMYPVNATTEDIRERYSPEEGNFQDVAIAGRIMSRRIMGAAAFLMADYVGVPYSNIVVRAILPAVL